MIRRAHTAVEALWRSPAAALLVPLSWIYRGALDARARRARPERVGAPVVSVGNIAVGGSGKTPLVLHLAEALTAAGRRVAIVSRGYGGDVERRGGIQVVSTGEGPLQTAAEAGDEPAMLAARLRVPVVAGPDRVAAARLAVRRFRPDVVLADDAFQHLALARDLDLVCVDGRDDVERLRLLPAGPLREPVEALGRAHAVLATKVEGEAARRAAGRLRRLAPRAEIFTAALRPAGVFDRSGAPVDLAGREVVAVAGIARPEDFERDLAATGARITARLSFPDHHPYAPADVGVIAAAAFPDRWIATTEKDAARLPADPRLRIAVLRVALDVQGDVAGWVLRRLFQESKKAEDRQ